MLPGRRKFRYLLATHGTAVVIALALIAALAFLGAGMSYVSPSTVDMDTESNQQTIETSLSTHATASNDTSMYDRGDRLEDQPVYLRNAAPTATVVAETAIPDASESELNQTVTLVYEARTRDGTMFWQDRERLAHDETHTERVRSEATLDIDEIADRHQAITADLGDGGSVDIYLEIKTNYQTDIYTGTEVERSNLSLRTNSYTIEPVTATNTRGTPSTEIQTDTTSGITLGEMVFLPYTTLVLGIIGAGAAGSAVVGYRLRRDIDPAVETAAIHHDRYEEWISQGKLPPIDSRSVIIMETLADLVDTAIDMNGRVIYDPTQNCYAVVSEQAVFVFVEE